MPRCEMKCSARICRTSTADEALHVTRPAAVTLRPAWPQDAQALAAMSRDLIEAGLTWRYTPARIAALMAESETMVLVAVDHSVQGCAVMQFGDEHAHLTLLCVQAGLQRRGVGWRLMGWLLESAQVAGMQSIQLELRADNTAALAFYERLGFAQTQLLPGYYEGRFAALRMLRQMGVTPQD